jgi:hypothetical protein
MHPAGPMQERTVMAHVAKSASKSLKAYVPQRRIFAVKEIGCSCWKTVSASDALPNLSHREYESQQSQSGAPEPRPLQLLL